MSSAPENENLSLDEIGDAIWDAIKLGLILINKEGKVLMWNDWMAQHSGIPTESALGHSLESLFLDGLSTPFKTAIKNALTHKFPIVLSNSLHRSPLPLYSLPVTKDGQSRMQQSITITPIIDSEKKHLCLIQVVDASVSIKRERVLQSNTEQLSIKAFTDGLTGAYNRRFFDERFKAELGRAHRQSTPLSLVMLDLDYFKYYNDSYGHPAGDKVLISVVNALKSQLNRATDIVARYGGEEFVVILPDCGPEGALTFAEKLHTAVANLNIPHRESIVADHVTISVGVATYQPGSNCSSSCLLETVDMALYNAKHSGRNCVRHLVTSACGQACLANSPQTPPRMPG